MNINIIEVDKRLYGIPTKSVCSIHEPIPVTPLPFAPNYVEGLINVGGEVVCQHYLARQILANGIRKDLKGKSYGQLLIVMNRYGIKTAFRIDRSIQMVSVNDELLGALDTGSCSDELTVDMISGQLLWNDQIILMLDVEKLVLVANHSIVEEQGQLGVVAVNDAIDENNKIEVGRQNLENYLVIGVGEECYAIMMDNTCYVEDCPEITALPHAPDIISGVIYTHEMPHLLVHLGNLLQIKNPFADKVVVVEFNGLRCALMVNKLVGIKRLYRHDGHEVHSQDSELNGYVFDGDDMIAVINIENMFRDRLMSLINRYIGSGSKKTNTTVSIPTSPLLTFRIGGEQCALPLQRVERVVSYHEQDEVPEGGGGYLAGVVQIQGEVYPVLDLRKQMGVNQEAGPLTAYIVAGDSKNKWALIVDQIYRVLEVPENQIETSGNKQEHVEAIARINGKLTCVIGLEMLSAPAAAA